LLLVLFLFKIFRLFRFSDDEEHAAFVEKVLSSLNKAPFTASLAELMLDQTYFNGTEERIMSVILTSVISISF
jgi:hypothetical protein